MMDKKQLNLSYNYCESIIKKNSKSFYLAFSKLPFPKNKAIYALYAFCRQADDSVDSAQNKEEQMKNITDLSKDLELFYYKNKPDGPIWDCLADVFSKYPMYKDAFRLQIKGQKFDIEFEQPDNLNDLITYSYHVASSVGLMMLPIIAQKNHSLLRKEAIDLGIAMQITNILRDIGEDYHVLNRIYLPKDLMNKYNVSEDMIKNKEVTQQFIDLWEYLAKTAEMYYEQFYKKIQLFDQDSQYQLLVASRLYAQILTVVRSNNYNCLHKKNKVPKIQMREIAIESKNLIWNF